MSTIKTETLSTPSNATVPVDTVVNGTAKAWVNFNGTGTVAIRRTFNVSSITDNSTGDYTVNFTTAMADVNYTAVATSDSTNSNSPQGMVINFGTAINNKVSPTTSALRVSCWVLSSGAGFDNPYINIAIFS
jgi:hypothetical protein